MKYVICGKGYVIFLVRLRDLSQIQWTDFNLRNKTCQSDSWPSPPCFALLAFQANCPIKHQWKRHSIRGKKYAKNRVDGNVNKECNLLHVTTKHALILLIYMLFVVCIPKKKTAKLLSDLLFFSIILRQKCNRQLPDTTESKTDTP